MYFIALWRAALPRLAMLILITFLASFLAGALNGLGLLLTVAPELLFGLLLIALSICWYSDQLRRGTLPHWVWLATVLTATVGITFMMLANLYVSTMAPENYALMAIASVIGGVVLPPIAETSFTAKR